MYECVTFDCLINLRYTDAEQILRRQAIRGGEAVEYRRSKKDFFPEQVS
jgi:hypothetical protein